MSDRDSAPDVSTDGGETGLLGRLGVPLDGGAAAKATVFAVVVVATLVAIQGAVTAAVTGGQQPMPQVERLPDGPTAAAWDDAPSRTVSLSEQQMVTPRGGGSVGEVEVRALTNESHVAFRVTWTDPTNDTALNRPEAFSDAAAVMLKGGDTPPITMGAAGTPVNIWYWRANWQYGDEPAEWSGDMYNYPHPENASSPGRQAENPLSRAEYDAYAQNYYAEGPGSVSHAQSQNVDARAVREGDQWSVTFTRERPGADGTYDAAFDENDQMYLAFAVWNGSAGEVNGQKSLSLQFTKLDTQAGDLAAANPGGDGGGDGASSGDGGDGDGGGGAAFGDGLGGFVTALVAAAVVSWLVIYWRDVR